MRRNINSNVNHVMTVVFCKTHLQINVHGYNFSDSANLDDAKVHDILRWNYKRKFRNSVG